MAQDLGLVSALDLAHLLQLGVDGTERTGHLDVRERVVVHGHAEDNGDGAVGQPVGNGDAHTGQEAVGAAGGVTEHSQPGQSLGPGGDHVGDGDQQAQHLLAGDVGTNHQPCQDRTQRHGDQCGHGAAEQGVQQGLPQDGLRHSTSEHILPIIQSKITHSGTGIAAQLRLSQGESRLDHGQQRDHDQAKQHDQADQNDHVKGILHNVQDQVFQPFLR